MANEQAHEVSEQTSDITVSKEDLEKIWPFDAYLSAWDTLREENGPLRILVCGKGGVGKSSLVNNLFELQPEDNKAREGVAGRAITSKCKQYERTTRFGDKVFVFDSPGFGDCRKHFSNQDIVENMLEVTDSKVDILLYCISLDGGCRVEHEDIRAFKIITEAFSPKIWTTAVMVLTFANKRQNSSNKEEYSKIFRNISNDIAEGLMQVPEVKPNTVKRIPIKEAGYTEDCLPYRDEEWRDQIYILALRRVWVEKFPALFEVRYRFASFEILFSRGGSKPDLVRSTKGRAVREMVLEILGPVNPRVRAQEVHVFGGGFAAHNEHQVRLRKVIHILKHKISSWQRDH